MLRRENEEDQASKRNGDRSVEHAKTRAKERMRRLWADLQPFNGETNPTRSS